MDRTLGRRAAPLRPSCLVAGVRRPLPSAPPGFPCPPPFPLAPDSCRRAGLSPPQEARTAPASACYHYLPRPVPAGQVAGFVMDSNMKQLQEALVDIETDAEQLLLARHELVQNDKMRNANREALTALRKRARTTKSSVPSPFDIVMKEMEGTAGKQLVKEICSTCGNHDPKEHTWLMFPGSDIFARVPFHATHTILEEDQERLDFDTKKLQSFVKEKSFLISEKGALADKISPGIVKSLVSLTDKPK
ncbi:hypothetical protein ZWY2020_032540 [Hordeum vulgare]|nr:hypothetical protein ZWY2020_032540 [Hordeum vulgare]